MSSPHLLPAPLHPPAFPRRSSRSRLQPPILPTQLPIPPRLVGSPLLHKLAHPDPATLSPKTHKQLWFDGDEFGTRANLPPHPDHSATASSTCPSTTPRSAFSPRSHRRTPSIALAHRTRSHSPPPPLQRAPTSIPPVPPIPSSAFTSPGAKRSVLRSLPLTSSSSSPSRARPPRIAIPDLELGARADADDVFGRASGGCYRFSPHAISRAGASPRRRPLGNESH